MPEKNNNVENNQEPIIEIPKEYYDKLKQEQAEKEKQVQIAKQIDEVNSANRKEAANLFVLTIINAIIIFLVIISMLKINEFCIIGLIAYIIIGSISTGLKYKKNNNFPTSILIGGILVAIITFILSTVDENNIDIWTHYAILSGATGIIGVITSGIINWTIYDRKNIKALQSIGILLYFITLLGGPYFFYKKYPEQFYKYIFLKKGEVVAKTEKEFVEKTLKNRYGKTFECQEGKRINNVMKYVTIRRTCTDQDSNEITVDSIAYDETNVEYVVQDNYIDIMQINEFKEQLATELTSITGGKNTIFLYPVSGCAFVGDCYDCEEYMNVYKEENDISNQYKFSTSLNLEKYLYMNATDFVNDYKFKYIIEISGRFGGYDESSFAKIIDNILEKLNALGLKNTYGYEISIKNSTEYNKVLYQVTGKNNNENIFSNPKKVDNKTK